MKKRLKVLGMCTILALSIVSPLGNVKADAHNSDGSPMRPTGLAIANAATRRLHSGHSSELISTVYNKYDTCYQVYQCKSFGCFKQYKIILPWNQFCKFVKIKLFC